MPYETFLQQIATQTNRSIKMTVIEDLINGMPVILGCTIGTFLIFKAIIWMINGSPRRVRIDEAEQMRNARAETLLLTIKMQHEAKMDEIKRQHEPKRREQNRTARKPLKSDKPKGVKNV